MKKKVDAELFEICKEIVDFNKTSEEWGEVESGDQFQTEHYCGGFVSLENAFCFGYLDDEGTEYSFLLSFEQVYSIVNNKEMEIELIPELS